MTARTTFAKEMKEAELQSTVLHLAQTLGWLTAHFRTAQTSRGAWLTPVSGDGAGFPDLLCVRGERIVAAELKAQRGRTTQAQDAWLSALEAAGVETFVWRPEHWLSGAIEEALR